jgi:hypothetical protein
MRIQEANQTNEKDFAAQAVKEYLGPGTVERLVTAGRNFPITSRADVQKALEQLLGDRYDQAIGVHRQLAHETLTISHVLARSPHPVLVGPLEHDDIDTGDAEPIRCVKNAIWMLDNGAVRYLILVTPAMEFVRNVGVHVEIGVPPGDAGLNLSRHLFRDLESRVQAAGSYRGRVISLEASLDFRGRGGAVKVHRLPTVKRDEVILPEATLRLLEEMLFTGGTLNLKLLGGANPELCSDEPLKMAAKKVN